MPAMCERADRVFRISWLSSGDTVETREGPFGFWNWSKCTGYLRELGRSRISEGIHRTFAKHFSS